jgi:hypothetical protein
MRLPNAQNATVDGEKIVNYLLNPAHSDNGGKFQFFTQLGFSREHPEVMANALKALATTNEVANAAESPHGRKYVIVGRIQSPGGKTPRVQTIWILDKDSDMARLVTAYPHKDERPHD